MTPRENSIPAKALAYIRLHGSARTRALAEHCGVSTSTMSALMTPYVKDGTLVTCKVDVHRERQQNEYRFSAAISGTLPIQTIAQRNAQHSATVGAAQSLVRTPVPGMREVSAAPFRPLRTTGAPDIDAAHKRASSRQIRFHSALHGDGRLVLELDGDTMVLAPAFTEEVARLLSGRAYQAKEIAA